MVYCCVPFCKNEECKVTGVSFHQFPNNEELREKWLKAISRQGTEKNSKWQPSKKSVVCSKHFENYCFSISTKNRRLLPNSIPSIFPEYPSYKQNKIKNDRRKKRSYDNAFPPKHSNASLPQSEIIVPENETHISNLLQVAHCSSCSSKKVISTKYCSRTVRRKNEVIANLRLKNKRLSAQLKKKNRKTEGEKIYSALLEASESKDIKAKFLLEQLKAFGKGKV